MLKRPPKLKYNGITLILSTPSRFDKVSLLTANGGELMNNHCLQPEYNLMGCDIRVSEDKSHFIEGTKAIMLLGEQALWDWVPSSRKNTLNELRGTLLEVRGLPAIASFFPQDATDVKNYEQQFNEQNKDFTGDEEREDDDDEGAVKSMSKTKRANYSFWLRADTLKIKTLITTGRPSYPLPIYKIFPSSSEVISILLNTKGRFLYFDMETDYEEQNLLCFSFSFDGYHIYSVPVLNETYSWSYSSLHFVLRALSIAIRDNTIVSHNGASFDFRVLAVKYNIPIFRAYDTMLAMHRCFPDIEKSLGHCTSYWTWEPFHKDTDSIAYRTTEHVKEKLKYCGKDVYTMFLVHQAITKYARTIPGLESSINCAMDSIKPYLTCSIQGIQYSQEKVDIIKKENDRLMMQYLRIINLLIGDIGIAECKRSVKGKAKAFPSSNTQCCCYFHDQLGYPVLFRSEKTGKPSLGKKILYKLALKYPNNPVITFTLMYRILQKEYGALKFLPWKDDENNICKPVDEDTQQKSFFSSLVSTSEKVGTNS